MKHWAYDAIFYHIYPLGLCGAPRLNDFQATPQPRLAQIFTWLDHIQELGCNALYLGPLFESSAHGYDTANYFYLDRRLGDNQTLADLSAEIHRRGMRLILDGVFNHVGRHFWAFRDVQEHQQSSAFCDWLAELRFGQPNSHGAPFSYQGWNGHTDLVKLNLHNPQVKDHLFHAVETWLREFEIDGLRLDTADCLDLGFLRDLAGFCRSLRPDFWLLGEVIHGDYRRWANADTLDSVTNYECYKGLYSSHADKNYFEIAYAFNRQFGKGGLYAGLPLYAFADNHDVNRVTSNLTNPAHLYPLHCLLYSMPGVPSIYYGSEWGIPGQRTPDDDRSLRPALDLACAPQSGLQPQLAHAITRLAQIRRATPALRYGTYQQVHVNHQQFAFLRTWEGEQILVAVNSAAQPVSLDLNLPDGGEGAWRDLLNPGESFQAASGKIHVQAVPSCWGRILRREG